MIMIDDSNRKANLGLTVALRVLQVVGIVLLLGFAIGKLILIGEYRASECITVMKLYFIANCNKIQYTALHLIRELIQL